MAEGNAFVTFLVVTIMTVSFILIWCIQVLVKYLLCFFITEELREDICGWIFRSVSHFFVTIVNPFWHVHRLNRLPKVANKKVIIMMNHLSNADPFIACGSLFPKDGTWVAKSSLFLVPIGGWAMGNSGDLSVIFKDKGNSFDVVKGSVKPMIEKAQKILRRGRMLCIFPEGTRNPKPNGDLYPFRLGFFQLALEEDAVIIPLAISGSEFLWPARSFLAGYGHAYLSFADPVEASKFSDAQQLADHVREAIKSQRATHPDRIAAVDLSEKKMN